MVPLSFAGHEFRALPENALFWPERRALIVADLHLEKASSFARLGQMLPPYDSVETLARLAAVAERCNARSIISLGDNFHDRQAEERLCAPARRRLEQLTARYDFRWIIGNHDPTLDARWGGEVCKTLEMDGLWFTHEPVDDCALPQLMGHFHPRIRLRTRLRRIWRPCFVRAASRLILPAFGVLTGGLDVCHPAIAGALGEGPVDALLPLADRMACFPLDRLRQMAG